MKNLIYNLKESIKRAEVDKIATIYAYYVQNANRFGIVELDENNKAISIEEKPENPKSNYAVTGLYFYPAGVAQKAKEIKPSERNEFEITDLNKFYLEENRLYVSVLGRGYSWFDAGTHESLSEASESIRILENRQGLKVCCPEEIAYINGWISKENLLKQAEIMKENPYGQHLYNVALGKIKY